MECYCVARKKPIRREKSKPQTATVIVCGFEDSSRVLNFMVIGHYTIDLIKSKVFSEFHSNKKFSRAKAILVRYANKSILGHCGNSRAYCI